MAKILITPRSLTKNGHPALNALIEAGHELVFSTAGKQPDEAELMRLLPQCAGYLAGVEPISASVLVAAKNLRVISRNGTGIDNIDLDAAQKLGIKICRAEGANARGVAELAMSLILSLARDIPRSDHTLKSDAWSRKQGVELENRTLGLIGCGRIGKLVAGFASAFGMSVLAYDLFPDKSFSLPGSFDYATLDKVMAESDFISLHCPPASDGRPIIDSEAIARMKNGVCIVNTARAGLVDDTAMLTAIESGKVAGFATDVFETEPPQMSALISSDKTIVTPHIGGYTSESVYRAVSVAVENILKELSVGS